MSNRYGRMDISPKPTHKLIFMPLIDSHKKYIFYLLTFSGMFSCTKLMNE